METIPHILWEPAYRVGNELLDAQHKRLFDIANRVIDIYGSGSDALLPAIKELIDYLSVHFQAETTVMMSMNYPHFFAHSREHRRFTDQVDEFLRDYQAGNPDLGFKMVVFLKDWIRDHTSKLDVQYGEYLRKNADGKKNPAAS
jgi:hemerythrin